jgi:hypothetical protein
VNAICRLQFIVFYILKVRKKKSKDIHDITNSGCTIIFDVYLHSIKTRIDAFVIQYNIKSMQVTKNVRVVNT